MRKSLQFNPWIFLSVAGIIADQLSKFWTVQHFELFEVYRITGFFNWTLTYNSGAAFSFLSNSSGWQLWFFTIIALSVSLIVIGLLFTTPAKKKWQSVALAFLLAGALGNVCDRLRLGAVVDFIQWHYQNWYWPTFNLADSFVVTAVIMWLIQGVFFKDEH